MKRKLMGQKKQLFTKRFFPAGNYTWIVPPGCTEVDVFLVGGGGGNTDVGSGLTSGGAGSGYTKTFKKGTTGGGMAEQLVLLLGNQYQLSSEQEV